MDFKAYLKELKDKGSHFSASIPEVGIAKVKIKDMVEDIVELEEENGNVFFLHYTNVIVVT
jgi:hypothetical protein